MVKHSISVKNKVTSYYASLEEKQILNKQSRQSYLIVVVYFTVFLFEILLHGREAISREAPKYIDDTSKTIFIQRTKFLYIYLLSFFKELLDMRKYRRNLYIANICYRLDIFSLLEKYIGLFMRRYLFS